MNLGAAHLRVHGYRPAYRAFEEAIEGARRAVLAKVELVSLHVTTLITSAAAAGPG